MPCFYCTNNLISGNTVLGNGLFDLYHEENCLGNTWTNNTYETAMGSEIYTYGFSRAREGLTEVETVVHSLFPDDELIHIGGGNIDTLGGSIMWNYHFRSPGEQEVHHFLYLDGKTVNRDTIMDSSMDDFNPITDPWMDSDSVIHIVDEMGGKAFRDEFELEGIEMGLQHTHTLYWNVHYVAQDTGFSAIVVIPPPE